MKQVARGAAAAISLAILLTACGSRPVQAGHQVRHTAHVTAAITAKACRAGDIWLGPGGYVSPMTGEHAAVFALRNLGHASCALTDYPKVDLYTAAGHWLAFGYTDGHSMYFTSHRPRAGSQLRLLTRQDEVSGRVDQHAGGEYTGVKCQQATTCGIPGRQER